jgi:hypothetical protein
VQPPSFGKLARWHGAWPERTERVERLSIVDPGKVRNTSTAAGQVHPTASSVTSHRPHFYIRIPDFSTSVLCMEPKRNYTRACFPLVDCPEPGLTERSNPRNRQKLPPVLNIISAQSFPAPPPPPPAARSDDRNTNDPSRNEPCSLPDFLPLEPPPPAHRSSRAARRPR